MTPKEKAKELVDKCSIKVSVYFTEDSIPRIVNADLRKESAKKFALISFDEVLQSCIDFIDDESNVKELCDFYLQVKQEIEKL